MQQLSIIADTSYSFVDPVRRLSPTTTLSLQLPRQLPHTNHVRSMIGKGGFRRHRKVHRDNLQGITKSAIRRLARRGGVKRISELCYEEIRGVIKVYLEIIIRDAVTYAEHARRKTIHVYDIILALKRQGRTLYGFGESTN